MIKVDIEPMTEPLPEQILKDELNDAIDYACYNFGIALAKRIKILEGTRKGGGMKLLSNLATTARLRASFMIVPEESLSTTVAALQEIGKTAFDKNALTELLEERHGV